MRETIGNLFNHLFSLRQSLFFPVLLGHILLATLYIQGAERTQMEHSEEALFSFT